jgi:hypothetical protein
VDGDPGAVKPTSGLAWLLQPLDLGAAYTLWMFKRVYLGPVANAMSRLPTSAAAFLMLLLAIAVLAWACTQALHRCDGCLGGRAAQACGLQKLN